MYTSVGFNWKCSSKYIFCSRSIYSGQNIFLGSPDVQSSQPCSLITSPHIIVCLIVGWYFRVLVCILPESQSATTIHQKVNKMQIIILIYDNMFLNNLITANNSILSLSTIIGWAETCCGEANQNRGQISDLKFNKSVVSVFIKTDVQTGLTRRIQLLFQFVWNGSVFPQNIGIFLHFLLFPG